MDAAEQPEELKGLPEKVLGRAGSWRLVAGEPYFRCGAEPGQLHVRAHLTDGEWLVVAERRPTADELDEETGPPIASIMGTGPTLAAAEKRWHEWSLSTRRLVRLIEEAWL